MTEDLKLLREYAENGSERAFAELVQRHVNLVYSTALRLVAPAPLATADVWGRFILRPSEKAGQIAGHEAYESLGLRQLLPL